MTNIGLVSSLPATPEELGKDAFVALCKVWFRILRFYVPKIQIRAVIHQRTLYIIWLIIAHISKRQSISSTGYLYHIWICIRNSFVLVFLLVFAILYCPTSNQGGSKALYFLPHTLFVFPVLYFNWICFVFVFIISNSNQGGSTAGSDEHKALYFLHWKAFQAADADRWK